MRTDASPDLGAGEHLRPASKRELAGGGRAKSEKGFLHIGNKQVDAMRQAGGQERYVLTV